MLIASVVLGGSKSDAARFKGATVDAIEKSLVMALKSPSPGVQASASQVIRDLKGLLPEEKFSLVTIPLMGIVKDENADAAVRIVAALALHDLESGMGDFAIERTAQFTDNERMKHVCLWLTYERLRETTGITTQTFAQN
ncbi:MAG TPA: hypothetical protein DGH68_12525 [Bacteroidetes bacterium]|nr:hypothetical protein [Bacteroidota bacterium]